MAIGKAERLKQRRHKGASPQGKDQKGSIPHGFSNIFSGLRRASQQQGWARGYDGPGKGTW